MTLRVPDTLTAKNSEKYRVSIRLSPGGLSFVGYIPSQPDSFFYAPLGLDRSRSYAQSVKDVLAGHSFFSYAYEAVSVVSTGQPYTLVPETIFAEDRAAQLMAFTFSSPGEEVLFQPLKELEAVLLFGIDPEIHTFLPRLQPQATFVHGMAPLLLHWQKQSRTAYPKQVYAVLQEDRMDVACFDKGTLLFINAFRIDDRADVLYYLLYIWKQLRLDPIEDPLFLSATPAVFSDLHDTLRNYLMQIEPMNLPAAPSNAQIPADVMALMECES
ncbi:DUF3822 family protein [Tannerella sp.]|uniref:DUF3822 family protein n=1 Tax=Tannerella sp. TaxID=2382127 RepID=UPI0026DBBD78|nr:DUF3822 family protein [Tannerella sp.]MDO4703307.1 DUF3822 family protein [Tannerella sp.]